MKHLYQETLTHQHKGSITRYPMQNSNNLKKTVSQAAVSSPTSSPLPTHNSFESLAPPTAIGESQQLETEPSIAHRPASTQNGRHTATTSARQTNRRPNICCNENHLNNFIPIRPGRASFANATKRGRRAFILSDSMMQRIRKREFCKHLKNTWGQIKTFPGANSRYLHHHMLPFILEECPDTLVVHGGTNDLQNRDKTAEQIADDLINIGHTAKSLGVADVIFSSLVIRKDGVAINHKRNAVNEILKDKVSFNNFIFIDNNDINLEDINDKDKVHLYESGSIKLANNILKVLNDSH